MKKYVILMALFIGISNSVSAQNVVIQSNTAPTQQSVDSNQYYINGISTREDIGGVQIERGEFVYTWHYKVKLTNYNNFPVSVIYQFEHGNKQVETRTMVLGAYSDKETETCFENPYKFVVIARKLSN